MKVIVAGFSKTGTKTLNATLKILGYDVYDYMEHVYLLREEWARILKEGWTTEDFRKMYENIDAVTDLPGYYFWEEIHKAFPEAKIILMVRDEEAWCKSMEKQLRTNESIFMLAAMMLLSPTFRKASNDMMRPFGRIVLGFGQDQAVWSPFGRMSINKELLKMKYRAHNAHVLQNAPPDKLLVFECSEGWKPLCEFLGVPIPEQPFPHRNKGGEIVKEMLQQDPFIQQSKREVKISLAVVAVVSVFGGYMIYSRRARSILSSIASALNSFRGAVGVI